MSARPSAKAQSAPSKVQQPAQASQKALKKASSPSAPTTTPAVAKPSSTPRSKKDGAKAATAIAAAPKPVVAAPVVTKEPPYSCKVLRNKGVVDVRVTMHRTPAQLIKFEPTETEFYLDTLRDSRKYLLR